ncbi:serine hydrolase domain-containing protein [soil metagenome]
MPSPRRLVRVVALISIVTVASACLSPENPPLATTPTTHTAEAQEVTRIVEDTMRAEHLQSAIVKVTVDGKEVLTDAFGESMSGVPATADMHFRNGAVAISYVSTLLLILAEEGTVGLDDTLSTWLPDIPHADEVTLRQLAQTTSGYHDYVIGNDAFEKQLYADQFRQWTPEELVAFATDKPLQYQPGTNWSYAHTNYVLLGLALEKATGEQMPELLSDKVLGPLGLFETDNSFTPEIPAPALHAYTSERRAALGIPDGTPFYEDSTYWNPSWTITHGAIQTTTIADLATSAAGIGSGKLLSEKSFEEFSTGLSGKTKALPGCVTCAPLGDVYDYGLGVVLSGDWLLQNPMFFGYAALQAYLPSRRIAIAVAVTFSPEAFDGDGNYTNAADTLFRRIGAELAPDDAPPLPPRR